MNLRKDQGVAIAKRESKEFDNNSTVIVHPFFLSIMNNHTSEWITQVAKDKRKTGSFKHVKTVKIILSELSHATQQL